MAANSCSDNDNIKEPSVLHPNVLRNLGLFQSSVGHWALRMTVNTATAANRRPFFYPNSQSISASQKGPVRVHRPGNEAEEYLDCRRKHPHFENFLQGGGGGSSEKGFNFLAHSFPATPSASPRQLHQLMSKSSKVGPLSPKSWIRPWVYGVLLASPLARWSLCFHCRYLHRQTATRRADLPPTESVRDAVWWNQMASIPTIGGVSLTFVIVVFPNVRVGSWLDKVSSLATVGTLNVNVGLDSSFANVDT